jgi:hypothetical protein
VGSWGLLTIFHFPLSVFQETAMNADELKALDKEVKKLKRISSEWASKLHDLVEDGLPARYEEIHGISQSTYEACLAWAVASAKLALAHKEIQE